MLNVRQKLSGRQTLPLIMDVNQKSARNNKNYVLDVFLKFHSADRPNPLKELKILPNYQVILQGGLAPAIYSHHKSNIVYPR